VAYQSYFTHRLSAHEFLSSGALIIFLEAAFNKIYLKLEKIPSKRPMDDYETELNFTMLSTSTKCPLTKDPLEDPVRSLRCNPHDAFEKSNIVSLINAYGGMLLCPLCNRPITLEDLVEDVEFREFLEEHKNELDKGVVYDLNAGEYKLITDVEGIRDYPISDVDKFLSQNK